jgi:hypothetical protein
MSTIGGGSRKSLEEAVETRWGFGGVEKNNFLSAGGVFFLNNSEHSAGFLALCTKLFLIHIQGL